MSIILRIYAVFCYKILNFPNKILKNCLLIKYFRRKIKLSCFCEGNFPISIICKGFCRYFFSLLKFTSVCPVYRSAPSLPACCTGISSSTKAEKRAAPTREQLFLISIKVLVFRSFPKDKNYLLENFNSF